MNPLPSPRRRPPRTRPLRLAILLTVGLLGCGGAIMKENGRRAAHGLRAIATAEVLLRAQDLDSNRLMDYWTGDVAQLHFMAPKGKPIGLIDKALAAADAQPLKPTPDPAAPPT